MLRYLCIAVFAVLATVSCKKQDLNLHLTKPGKVESDHEVSGRWRLPKSGVVLSFDDRSVNEWFELNKLIASEYNWKATFFVNRFSSLSSDKIEKLRSLQSYGHEIAGHGLNHLDAVKYIQENGSKDYIDKEITPMLQLMRSNRLWVVNFAYPFGSRNASTDSLLLKYFHIVRGTTYSSKVTDVKDLKCYYSFDQNRVVYGLGIDEIYNNPVSYIQSVLRYAKENNKIVILYAHTPVSVATAGQYQTSYSTVQEICKYVKENGMRFYNMRDLYRLR